MEFYRIWRVLIGYKRTLILLPLIATAVGLGLTYIIPEEYESIALVLVRPYQPVKFNPSERSKNEIVDFPVNLSASIDSPSKTYMEVIKSDAVAKRIVGALQLDVPQQKQYSNALESIEDKIRTWFGAGLRTLRNYLRYGRDIPATPFEIAVEDVEKDLTAAIRKDTYVFDITYRSHHPKRAADVANMAAEIFLEQGAQAYKAEATRHREFIGTQLEEARKALDQARAATLVYKNSGGTFDLKAEYDAKLKNVSDLEDTLAKAKGALASLTRTGFTDGPTISGQAAQVNELKKQISALQAQLSTYRQKEKQLNAIVLAERLAEQSFELFSKEYQEARVKEAATVSEIRIVARAAPALYPVRPVKYVYAGLSFTTALVVAIGWALFFEALSPRVRTPHDLDPDLGVPVLGAIPNLSVRRNR